MSYTTNFTTPAPQLEDLAALPGTLVLEFGTAWCGHCQAAQPLIQSALAQRDDITHIKVEDGPGRKLGRQFKVKLWPSLVVLRRGQEIGHVVRPQSAQAVQEQLPHCQNTFAAQ